MRSAKKTYTKKIAIILLVVTLFSGCAVMRMNRLADKEEAVSVVTYHLETIVNKPADEVFDLIKAWNTYVVDYASYSENSSYGLTKVGDYSVGEATLAGRKVSWNEVVTEFEEDKVVRLVYSGDMRGSITMGVEPKGDKTLYSFTGHMFFLPDNILNSALEKILEQNLLGELMNDTITKYLVKDLSRFEGKSPEEFELTGEPSYDVFVDAYFTAEEVFPMLPGELFKLFNSTEGMASVLPFESVEPVGDSPGEFSGLGNRYRLTTAEGMGGTLAYDMVVVQFDPPWEARYYLIAHGVCMELDLLIAPAASGSRVLMITILDLPESVTGRALEVIIHTSDFDKKIQEALTAMKSSMEGL